MNQSRVLLPSLDSYTASQVSQACVHSQVLTGHLAKAERSNLYGLRHQVWAQAILATFHQTAPTAQICAAWSETAEFILTEKFKEIFGPANIALFAFGKLGAKELNLSSDVDLLFVTDICTDQLLSQVRLFQKSVSEMTENGFLFRVDYELRPGGKSGPLLPQVDQLVDYYGNYGETWERMAFIRLRALCGSPQIISEVQNFRKKFSFRKHLDFGLLEDLNGLRNKVHAFALSKQKRDAIDLKLGLGGIRDIELFCHALQVIHGGRNILLHTSSTSEAFDLFEKNEILPAADCVFLKNFYWRLRHFENSVQGKEDQQTYHLPVDEVSPADLSELQASMNKAAVLVAGLLGQIEAVEQFLPENLEDQRSWLLARQFSQDEIDNSWEELRSLPLLSRQKERDTQLRSRFMAKVLTKMGTLPNSSHRLIHLKEFLHSIRAKTSFYSLLLKNEVLLDLLSEIFCSSPFLSRLLSSRPEILDSIVMRNVDSLNVDSEWDDFLAGLADIKQLTEFLAGTDFLRTRNLEKLFTTLSELADDIVSRLWDKIQKEHGSSGISIWALGKWGGKELGIFSDLDCIFVKAAETQESDLKALRRFLSRITESHRGGSLYSVDTRLRTSSQTGILVTTESELLRYLEHSSSPWERQAYLKARSIGSSQQSMASMKNLLIAKGLSDDDLRELNSIRLGLLKNKKGEWDLKYIEGGLIDVELAVQTALLQHQIQPAGSSLKGFLASLEATQTPWKLHGKKLLENYLFMRLVEQELRLVSEESQPVLNPAKTTFHSVSAHMQLSAEELQQRLRSALQEQVEVLNSLDPRRGQKYQ